MAKLSTEQNTQLSLLSKWIGTLRGKRLRLFKVLKRELCPTQLRQDYLAIYEFLKNVI